MTTNFTTKTLRTKLLSQACNGFQVNRLGDDEFCLIQENGLWQVVYTERGAVQEVLFESESEAAACDFLYSHVTRFRHNHLAGWFWDLAEAQTLSAQLTQLGIKNDVDGIPWSKDRQRYRVMVYDKDVFKVRRQYGKLPLERVPGLSERIHGAIQRLREFVPHHDFELEHPIDEIEQQVWSALEFSCGYRLPEVYSRFLPEVSDGGRCGTALTYLSMRQVFEANHAERYKQPVPEFVQAALMAPDQEMAIAHQDITASFPGLLRISTFSYNQMAWYIARTGEFVFIEDLGQELRVSVEQRTLEQFYQDTLDVILGYGQLNTYEHTFELMQFGASLSDLEQSLRPIAIAGPAWTHGIIAQILNTTPDDLEQKLIAWQEQHGTP